MLDTTSETVCEPPKCRRHRRDAHHVKQRKSVELPDHLLDNRHPELQLILRTRSRSSASVAPVSSHEQDAKRTLRRGRNGGTYLMHGRVLDIEYGHADGAESRWQRRLPDDVHETRDPL